MVQMHRFLVEDVDDGGGWGDMNKWKLGAWRNLCTSQLVCNPETALEKAIFKRPISKNKGPI